MDGHAPRVGYVLKMYPRFSETFIVNEMLAHERAGAELEICLAARRPSTAGSTRTSASVRAPVTYLPAGGLQADDAVGGGAPGHAAPRCRRSLTDARRRRRAPTRATRRQAHRRSPSGRRERGIEPPARALRLGRHDGRPPGRAARRASRTRSPPTRRTSSTTTSTATCSPGSSPTRAPSSPSATSTSRYLRELAPRPRPVERVYNGLDLRRFPYAAAGATAPRTVVAVGRLVEKKGFDDLVDARARCWRATGATVPCRIVGAGPARADAARADRRARARRLGRR